MADSSLQHIGLVALDGCYGSSLSGLIDVLQVANAHIRNLEGDHAPQFSWEVLSETGSAVVASGGLKLMPDKAIADAGHCDLLYIPAVFYPGARDFEQWLQQQAGVSEWLKARWQAGAGLAANCTGTFLLAETGVLNNRKATTTWWLEPQFRRRYPWVNLNVKEMITEQDRLICAGAMTSYLYLATRLIERHASPEIASLCAKAMLIDVGHTAQSPYQSLFATEFSGDATIAKAQYWLQTHLQDHIELKALADELGMSQRTLIRKFKAELEMTPLTYLQNLRIETAKKLLESTSLPLVEVIAQVGYSDASSFSRLFQKRLGLTPAMYRHRFRPGSE